MQQTACTYCLQVPELVEKICASFIDYTDPPPTDLDESRRSLVKLAQTCKSLKEPALDAVYVEIFGIHRLFMMFPHDTWMIDDDELVS